MVTAIYSLSNVHGAELWLLFWMICLIIYVAGCFIMRPSRTRNGIKTVLLGLLIAELVIDLIWAIFYYHNGNYINYGLGAIYGLMMWIPALIITGIIVTAKNKRAAR